VSSFDVEVFDVTAQRLVDAQPVECEQCDERSRAQPVGPSCIEHRSQPVSGSMPT
jgi:hypothetical protein